MEAEGADPHPPESTRFPGAADAAKPSAGGGGGGRRLGRSSEPVMELDEEQGWIYTSVV